MLRRRRWWAGEGTCNTCEQEKRCGFLVGKAEGKRWLGRSRSRWEGNIKMHLKEICWEGAELLDLSQYRKKWRAIVYTAMNI